VLPAPYRNKSKNCDIDVGTDEHDIHISQLKLAGRLSPPQNTERNIHDAVKEESSQNDSAGMVAQMPISQRHEAK
jgi:hypothetical protein